MDNHGETIDEQTGAAKRTEPSAAAIQLAGPSGDAAAMPADGAKVGPNNNNNNTNDDNKGDDGIDKAVLLEMRKTYSKPHQCICDSSVTMLVTRLLIADGARTMFRPKPEPPQMPADLPHREYFAKVLELHQRIEQLEARNRQLSAVASVEVHQFWLTKRKLDDLRVAVWSCFNRYNNSIPRTKSGGYTEIPYPTGLTEYRIARARRNRERREREQAEEDRAARQRAREQAMPQPTVSARQWESTGEVVAKTAATAIITIPGVGRTTGAPAKSPRKPKISMLLTVTDLTEAAANATPMERTTAEAATATDVPATAQKMTSTAVDGDAATGETATETAAAAQTPAPASATPKRAAAPRASFVGWAPRMVATPRSPRRIVTRATTIASIQLSTARVVSANTAPAVAATPLTSTTANAEGAAVTTTTAAISTVGTKTTTTTTTTTSTGAAPPAGENVTTTSTTRTTTTTVKAANIWEVTMEDDDEEIPVHSKYVYGIHTFVSLNRNCHVTSDTDDEDYKLYDWEDLSHGEESD